MSSWNKGAEGAVGVGVGERNEKCGSEEVTLSDLLQTVHCCSDCLAGHLLSSFLFLPHPMCQNYEEVMVGRARKPFHKGKKRNAEYLSLIWMLDGGIWGSPGIPGQLRTPEPSSPGDWHCSHRGPCPPQAPPPHCQEFPSLDLVTPSSPVSCQ